jgi:hypothetical protein
MPKVIYAMGGVSHRLHSEQTPALAGHLLGRQ